jgi:hypothetical protein
VFNPKITFELFFVCYWTGSSVRSSKVDDFADYAYFGHLPGDIFKQEIARQNFPLKLIFIFGQDIRHGLITTRKIHFCLDLIFGCEEFSLVLRYRYAEQRVYTRH